MTLDYKALLTKLKGLAQEHLELGEEGVHAELLTRIKELQIWIESGMNGAVPFDFSEYEIDIEDCQIQEDLNHVSSNGNKDDEKTSIENYELGNDIDQPLKEKELNENLYRAIEFYNGGNYKESLTLSQLVVERAKGISDEILQNAKNLAENSRREMTREIDNILDRGNELFEQGEIEQAEEEYKKARDLDPENKRVLELGRKAEKEYKNRFNQENWNRLRAQLRDSRNLESLREAIYKAKALDLEGLLDDELQEILVGAETKYTELAIAHGEETTMMRFDDLSQRAKAVEKIRQRFVAGEENILDATTGTIRKASEVLKEAERLYKEASERAVSHDIDVINAKFIPCHPKSALERLKKYESLQLEMHYKDLVDNKKAEVEQVLANKENAEFLYNEAQKVSVPWEKYRLYLQANAVYPLFSCKNMQEELKRISELALSHLCIKIEDEIEKQIYFCESDQVEAIQKSLAYFNEIDKLYNNWPENEAPQEIKRLKEKQTEAYLKLQDRLGVILDFEKLATQVRDKVMDPNQRQIGLELYKEIVENPKYESLSQRNLLGKEIDIYKDVGLRILEIRKAEAMGDWEQLFELSRNLLDEGKAEKFGNEVKELFKKAAFEVDVQKIKTLVARDEIIQAEKLLSKLLVSQSSIGERLDKEKKVIESCRQNDDLFKPIFQEAEQLAQQKSLKEKTMSLTYYDFLAGNKIEKNEREFPQYELNYYTVHARAKRILLSKDIKSHVIATLRRYHKQMQSNPTDNFATLQKRANEIKLLRETKIDLADEEYELCKKIEIKYALIFERDRKELNQWEEIYQVWNQLDKVYFNDFEIEKHKQRAMIRIEIDKSEKIRIEKGIQEAMDYLKNKLNDPKIKTNGEILLAMADIALLSKNFSGAKQFLGEARRDTSVSESCIKFETKLENEWIIYEGVQKADWFKKNGQILNAFQTLSNVKNKLNSEYIDDISNYIDDLYANTEAEIVQKVTNEIRSDTNTSRLSAITSLMELNEIEEVVSIPDGKRNSIKLLEQVSDDLDRAVTNLLEDSRAFDYSNMAIDSAFDELQILLNRLRALMRLKQHEDLSQKISRPLSDLRNNLDDLSEYEESIHGIKTILDKYSNNEIFYEAVRSGDFRIIETDIRCIEELQNFPLRESLALMEKYYEFHEIYTLICEKRDLIILKFQKEENFDEVIQQLKQLSELPPLRKNRQIWRYLFEKDYKEIIKLSDDQFRIFDPFGNFVGMEPILQEAIMRKGEFEYLQKTENKISQLMDKGQEKLNDANILHETKNVSLNEKYEAWKNLKLACEEIEKLSSSSIINEPHSNKARQLYSIIKKQNEIALSWSKNAIEKSKSVEPPAYPSEKTWNDVFNEKNQERLHELIKKAVEIGPTNEKEERYLSVARRLERQWEEERQQRKESIVNKILEVFRKR